MRISDWSSDVCSSDLTGPGELVAGSESKILACQGQLDRAVQMRGLAETYRGFEHGGVGREFGGSGRLNISLVGQKRLIGQVDAVVRPRTTRSQQRKERKRTRLTSSH